MLDVRSVFAIGALAAALGLAGCEGCRGGTSRQAPAPAPTAAPAPAGPLAPTPPESPPECAEYKAIVDRLTSCASLPPASRDAMRRSFEQNVAAWAKIPAEGRPALANTCKNAADAMRPSAGACL